MNNRSLFHKIRPWIYFAAFIVIYGGLSTMPEVDGYLQYLFFAVIFVLSAVTLWRWWKDPEDPRAAGVGISRLPLPERWKRWMYDEPDPRNR